MATYKTISCKDIVRKVMRDLKPDDANWIYDAVEWIGEALEHVGAGAHVESKGCILDIKDFKGTLPADLYYINQVSVNEDSTSKLSTKIDEIQKQVRELKDRFTFEAGFVESTLNKLADGTISSDITTANLESLDNIRKGSNTILNKVFADASVVYTAYTDTSSSGIQPLCYCTTNFPRGIHCEGCINETTSYKDCYLIENDRIKTSFETGKICLSYTAFATDTDCWPLVPDDISFKEAMFWYIYKKLLLSGMVDPNNNGLDYSFADQKWKYYCTQARNEAKYPDIDRYESFMNQWVRLIPQMNRHDNGFEDLGLREDLYRGNYSTSL
tara:strand:- start:31089 stop:32072 length:984 start_codon:yes stop_codon:yes gene_type:complete